MLFASKLARSASATTPEWTPGASARLRVSEPSDAYEHEADRVAEQVMRMPDATASSAHPRPTSLAPTLQRKCSACEDEQRGTIQRKGEANVTTPAGMPATLDSLRSSGGQPLPADVRSFFEPRFGADFSRVRVHASPRAEQAARDLQARAFTIGRDVVFGPGEYRPHTPAGRHLLAHELAHVIQQGATQSSAPGASVQSHVGPMLQRQGNGQQSPDVEARARTAELFCDLRTLCQLRFAEPGVVGVDRVRRAHARCNPGARLSFPDPCLMPNFGLPAPAPSAGPSRPTASPSTSTAPSSSGGVSLPSTNIRFNLGPAAFDISLPASLAIRLPAPYQGAQRVVFALDASPSGFSFTVTVNAVPHVRIIARAGVTTEGAGSAGLTVETTRTVCRVVEEQAARTALQAAGTRLRDAILAVQSPPPVAADASELERTFGPQMRLADVVAAIANVNSEIEKVRASCREVPLGSVELGVRGPLIPPRPGEPPNRGENYLGVTGTLRF